MNASNGMDPNENNPNPFRSKDQQKGKGRPKVRMEKIENERNLQVTFSKRRGGIFKKASELNTLCGAKSAILIFSPCNRAHTYGHPDVETIANRFLNTNTGPTPPSNSLLAALHEAGNHQLNRELVHLEGQVERERQRKKELDHMFDPRINEMSYEELNRLHESLLGFKSAFESQLNIVQGPKPEQGGHVDPCLGFTNPADIPQDPYGADPSFGGMGYLNAGDPTRSTSFNPDMGSYIDVLDFVHPFGDISATTADMDETQLDDSNICQDVINNARGQKF